MYFCLCTRQTHSGILGVDMMTNLEVRTLLVLWEFGDKGITQAALNSQIGGKNTTDKNDVREKLITTEAIKISIYGRTKAFTLTALGTNLLSKSLIEDGFLFDGKTMGTKMANVLLKWYRSQPKSLPVVKAAVSSIDSYEAFKVVALEIYDALNRDFNMDNLVPIYRIRRAIGDRVSRGEFSEWLMEMQARDHLQLIGGEMPSITPDIAQDSITTSLGAARYYAKRI